MTETETSQTDFTTELAAMADLATPMALRVAATLGVAEHLPADTKSLAGAVDADIDALDRVLRHLATAGVLTRDDDDRYALTDLGAGLRRDHPAGLRARWDIDGALGHADLSFVRLLHSVRTGEPAYSELYGRPFWESLSEDRVRSAAFDEQMGIDVGADAPLIVSAYDWGALGHVVDVGGGNGTLLIALLNEYPTLRGTVVELPGAAETARKMFDAAGLDHRADAVAGDFFAELPTDAEGYLLSAVLHNWGDDDARTILRNCAAAAGADGAVFVIEKIAETVRTEMDLRGLALFGGGRERDVAELTALAESAGLAVAAVHTAGAIAIVELSGP
jgi:hypothetical protein